jgi:MFS family permease
VRGGAIVPLIWGGLLTLVLVMNFIWTDDPIQTYQFATAIGMVLALVVLLVSLSRGEALHRGEPELDRRPRAIPQTSFAAAGAGLAFGMFVFGFTFGSYGSFELGTGFLKAPTVMGFALLLLAIGRLVVEKRAERRAVEQLRERRPS